MFQNDLLSTQNFELKKAAWVGPLNGSIAPPQPFTLTISWAPDVSQLQVGA